MSQFTLPNIEVSKVNQSNKEFLGIIPVKLPEDGIKTVGESAEILSVLFAIDDRICISLKSLAKEHQVEISTVFMAVLNILLQRYTGLEDFLVADLERRQESEVQTGESFINKIYGVRSQFNSKITFIELLNQLQNKFAEASEANNSLFGGLDADISNERDLAVFQTLFMLAGTSLNKEENGSYLNQYENFFKLFKNFYIGLILEETSSSVQGAFYYDNRFLSEDFIISFKNHFINLLQAAAKTPNESIGTYQILTSTEWKEIVVDFNNTAGPYTKEKTINNLFEEQAINHPDQIALSKGSKTVTYNELNKQANRLAHFLINNGILSGDNVGLLVTRDFEMIIGMLAIMKTGAAYVPIDPDYPIERQEYIYNQSQLKMVIADMDYPLKTLLDENNFTKINFSKLSEYESTNPTLKVSSSQLAYTIYTSGSTGKPKGVMIEHHSAVNLIQWVNNQFSVDQNDRLLFITSMCFDLSVYDIFGMLAAGGTIVIAEQHEIKDVQVLQKMLADNKITFWDSVPTTMDYLVKNLELENPEYRYNGLKTVFLSGDWIPVNLPDRIKRFFPQADVISLGGATEGTVWSNFYPVKQTLKTWKSIPYGRPITNNFFYILNEQLQPVPLNVAGDLYIGGSGVARGYANDPDKTRAAFIADPFNTDLGGVMYKTGDLGRMLPGLNMEFIGRKDNQVKIQGFRIELGEIESVLNSSDLVNSAVVLAKDDAEGKKRLVGYVVPKNGFNRGALVDYLKTKLPDYMIPAVWVEMESIPVTANGKIDRKFLPDVESTIELEQAVAEPLTKTEVMLIAIWKQSMGLASLSVNDNFFELGGHSLLAVQILSKLQKNTGKSYQLAILFKYPDIKSLARHIDHEENDNQYISLVAIKPTGSKAPLYIIHGDGLNVLNFSPLAAAIDLDQPIYGLQAKGLNGTDEPSESLPDITRGYLEEIIRHNPTGPYLLAGYSFGGYVAMEMRKQMMEMGKEVKMLIMFDTNAEKTEYKDWYALFPRKVKRNIPKMLAFLKSSLLQPITTIKDQTEILSKKILTSKKESKLFYQQVKKIQNKHLIAFRNYQMTPFNDKVYLFKAKICVHYVNDTQFLGWKKYAKGGVEVLDVPGDHLSMFVSPNVQKLALILQKTLDSNF